jgi:cyanophycinase
MHRSARIASLLALALLSVGCSATGSADAATGRRGTLLAIGGGLDDDNRPVYERFAALAAAIGPPGIVIATAATWNEDDAATGQTEAFATWCPGARVEVVKRGTDTAATVAAIDRATAMFFTGGDQKRITDRYRPDDKPTPEWEAMMRLLQRGGVIAGTSAGDAMMGEVMFHTGRSAEALGIAVPRRARAGGGDDDDDGPPKLGPQIGPGMHFVPWVVTDSHFFERDRVGRLVAALEASGRRLGIGVGEDACVEIDLATGMLTGTSVADSLLVDIGALSRDGLARRNVAALVVRQGTRVSLPERLESPPQLPPRPAGDAREVPAVEPGQNRQLASWRLFTRGSQKDSGLLRLQLNGWCIEAWPDGKGEVGFDVLPQ